MPEEKKKNSKKKKFILFLVLMVILGGGLYYVLTRGRVSTDNAYVDGQVYTITPRVAGFVVDVQVEDNQPVEAGQVLVKLDPVPYEVALAEAKASLAESEATLDAMELGVPLELSQTDIRMAGAEAELLSYHQKLDQALSSERAAGQELVRAKAEYRQAQLDFRRASDLTVSGAVAREALDKARTRLESSKALLGAAQAGFEAAQQQLGALKANTPKMKANVDMAATGKELAQIKTQQVEAQKARVELARSRVRQAELDLGYTTVRAPETGFVTKKSIQEGRMVSRGQPLMAVVPLNPDDLWITANFKETQLTDVRPGQEVEVKVDTYPGIRLAGRVESIMAGTGAAFSLFPPENATGNFVKVVQRIPVKIVLDSRDRAEAPILRIGMSVVPTIYTRPKSR